MPRREMPDRGSRPVFRPLMHGAIEILVGPTANAGVRIRRDVGREEGAERRRNRHTTCHRLGSIGGVAGSAVGGYCQLPTPLCQSRVCRLRVSLTQRTHDEQTSQSRDE